MPPSRGPTRDGGYLLRDDRLSGGALFEAKTFTCTHCNAVVVMNPERRRERAWCPGCAHVICDSCEAVRVAAGFVCTPLEKTHDQIAAAILRKGA